MRSDVSAVETLLRASNVSNRQMQVADAAAAVNVKRRSL